METDEVEPSWLVDEIALTVEDLESEVVPRSDASDTLDLSGLEGVLAVMALKAVVGIASSFIGKVAYGKWKEAQSRRQLQRLVGSLGFDLGSSGSVVDEVTVRHDLREALVDQGLSVAQAESVVGKAFTRIRARMIASA